MCGTHLDWESIQLPPAHILKHLTDAHCHPTDTVRSSEDYDGVQLGGVAAMATADDQERVAALSAERPWSSDADAGPSRGPGPRVVASFGYHPWFVHRFSLQDPPPPREEHYRSILSPRPAHEDAFIALLPHLPHPEAFAPRLVEMRAAVEKEKAQGRLVLVGEIGLDGAARVRIRPTHSLPLTAAPTPPPDGAETRADDHGIRNSLSPFKTAMSHQVAIARAQLEVAIDLGVPVSLHCVSASGATLELLQAARKAHGHRFSRINICIHSCGGMSSAFLSQAAKVLPNTFFSPSVTVTARSNGAAESVRVIPRDRLLVESDAPDARELTRIVWAAVEWVAECRGWRVEGEDTPEWEDLDEEEEYDDRGRIRVMPENEVWAVRTLERNWARFMGLVM